MSSASLNSSWSGWQKASLRIAFVFFGLLALPLDAGFWRALFSGDYGFQTLFRLTAYSPQFWPAPVGDGTSLAGFASLGVTLLIALVGAALWGALDRGRTNYDSAYYLLRVVLRYRLALGLIGFGVLKVFPYQFPAPTLSELHTPYGEFAPWKIYYLTTAVSGAYYKQALGLFEIATAVLLLWRPAATFAAVLAASMLVNIVLANIAYGIGEQVYAATLLLFAAAVFAHDTPRLFALLVGERTAKPDTFLPAFSAGGLRARRLLRFGFAGFGLAYGVAAYASLGRDHWPFPTTPGVKGLHGYYEIREFRLDGVARPHSLTDPLRWQNVVFEEWNTVSIRLAQPLPLDARHPLVDTIRADDRSYESAGNSGRRFYTYTPDTSGTKLRLAGQNVPAENFELSYTTAADGTVRLSGQDATGRHIDAVLERADKKYLLYEGRRTPLSIY